MEIFWADKLDRWPFEHGVVFFADITGIFNGFFEYIVDALVTINVNASTSRRDDIVLTALVQIMPT